MVLTAATGAVHAQKSRIRKAEAAEEATATIRGRLTLTPARNQTVSQDEIVQAVIYFLPAAGSKAPAPRQLSTATYTKGFQPNLLVATVGSTVSFPNRDTIIHNVFSATPGSNFTLGSFGPGEVRSQRLDRPGLVVVNCNVHRGMRANVLVLGTPHSTQARADGGFTLSGLPAAPGTLVIWHPRAVAQSLEWDGRRALNVERALIVTRPRIGAGS